MFAEHPDIIVMNLASYFHLCKVEGDKCIQGIHEGIIPFDVQIP
jgi:hypothetical protein